MKLSIDWDQQPLGKMPDQQLANQLGCGWRSVFRARTKRKIRAWQSHSAALVDHVPVDLLGKVSDQNLAKEYRCRWDQVYKQRVRYGIPAFCPPSLSARRRSCGSRKIIPALLGKFSDVVLAELWGVHFSNVYYHRKKRGIPAASHSSRSCNVQWKKGDADLLPLGKVPDREIAEQLGMNTSSVADIRNQMDIRPAACRDLCVCGKPALSAGRFCSHRCGERVRWGWRGINVIDPRTGKKEKFPELDQLAFALAQLSKTIWDRLSPRWRNQ